MEKPAEFNLARIALISALLITLFHPLRSSIIELIDQKKSVTVTQIYEALEIDQAIASQHLARMRKYNLVRAERKGHFVFYSLNYPRIEYIMKLLNRFFEKETFFNLKKQYL